MAFLVRWENYSFMDESQGKSSYNATTSFNDITNFNSALNYLLLCDAMSICSLKYFIIQKVLFAFFLS